MKRCPSCSVVNVGDGAFCIHCGFPLAGVTADATGSGRPPPPAPGYLAPGVMVDGKYEIQRVLGEGGMGVVYLARDVHTEMPVVVKSIRAELADNPEFRARTLAEGRALARIDHPNVVRLNAVVVESNALYLVMQFIDGEPLDRMIERYVASRAPMPVPLVLSIFRMILLGVGAAHAEGLIHRDLKPANILVRRKDGVAKVTDFGIAKGEEDAKAGRGVTRGIIGSISYMAPEQVRGQRDLDKRVDIYALGIVLHELLIGRAPFEAASDYELMRLHAEAPMPSARAQRPDIPLHVDAAIQRACAKDRAARFGTVEEFMLALEAPPDRPVTVPFTAPPSLPPPARAGGTEIVSEPPIASFHHAGSGHHTPPRDLAPRAAAAVITGEGASLPPGPRPARRSSGAWIWITAGIVLVGGGSAAAYFVSTGEPPATRALVPEGGPAGTSRGAAAGASTATTASTGSTAGAGATGAIASTPGSAGTGGGAAAPSPLALLAGPWRSSSKRAFTAVLTSDDALEFRVVNAAEHPRQGYQSGEVRFKLTALPGSTNEFAVEDRIRPTPPPGLEYDPKTSRDSCVGSWTAVKGQKLRAQYDGAGTLTVDLVQIRTGAEKFTTRGKSVTGCVDLAAAPAEPIESKLSRAP